VTHWFHTTHSTHTANTRDSERAWTCTERGVTLLEMIVVVALIAVMIGITFPAVGAGLESLRLREGAEDVVTAFNSALIRSERLQQAVAITISPGKRLVETQSLVSGASKKLELPDGVNVVHVFPSAQGDGSSGSADQKDRTFLIYPDGSVPRISLDLENRRGKHRLVSLDPITGVARQVALSEAVDPQTALELAHPGEPASAGLQ
jgi:prepilin-type N-terminal cleavage/methylation domain-containing protein